MLTTSPRLRPAACLTALVGLLLATPAIAEKPATTEDGAAVDLLADVELADWVAEAGDDQRTRWTLVDGILRCAGGKGGFLRYDREVCDFVFRVEYRMSKGCNSGIGLRGTVYKGDRRTRPSFAGYELQILDDAGKPAGKHSSTSLYRYLAPTENASRPAGEWNQLEITCRGPKIQVVLNGKTVHDVDQRDHEATRDKRLCGYLSLQNHGKVVEFRNVTLEELPAKKDVAAKVE